MFFTMISHIKTTNLMALSVFMFCHLGSSDMSGGYPLLKDGLPDNQITMIIRSVSYWGTDYSV